MSVDVNSARNREAGNVEDTALMTNLEAVRCLTEQLILRDLGGLVIIDFIDMENREHQRLVQLSLRKELLSDKAKTQVALMSRFGLVEMTRQRTRPSHKMVSQHECQHCVGTGVVKTAETVEIECLRAIRRAVIEKSLERIEIILPPDLAISVLNNRRAEVTNLEERYQTRISFVGDSLIKDRSFRLVPTQRRGKRRTQEVQPVRPSMIAPLLDEQVRIAREARAMMDKTPDQVEKEIYAITEGIPLPTQSADRVPAVQSASVIIEAPSLWQDALVLRELLFSQPSPAQAQLNTSLASPVKGARTPSPRGRSRHRRRSPKRG